jgi:spermidine synthase
LKPAARRAPDAAPAHHPAEEAYVLGASFVSGAVVLVLEILGTRVVSPYYGASVYVWSSLIAVTLAALAGGYTLGGRVADRRPDVQAFALELIGGAVMTLLVPWTRNAVLSATTPLGLALGSLVSAAVLFGPPLVLLAMTGPLAIRLVTRQLSGVGRGVGVVYGVSTLGSLVGALATGFLLVPHFGVRALLLASAAVLLLTGGVGLLLAGRRTVAVATAAGALVAVGVAAQPPEPPSGVVEAAHSFYGEIRVVDAADARLLLINGLDNGFVDRTTFESRAPYIPLFDYLPAARPAARRALAIGLGAGSVPRTLRLRHGLEVEAVEIAPEVADIARRWFGFPADVPIAVADGRTFVETTEARYDFVVLDAFSSETHPAHLFTREFFARVAAILTPEGILAINTAGMPHGDGASAWRSVHRTLAVVFPEVRVFAGATVPREDVDRHTNVLFFASAAPLPDPASLDAPTAVRRLGATEMDPAEPGPPAYVLTDDWNPLDDLQRRLFVLWRGALLREAPEVLLEVSAP